MSLQITPDRLSRAIENTARLTGEEIDVRSDYSGRGMYGDTCLGFVADEETLAVFEVQLAILATLEDPEDYLTSHADIADAFLDVRAMRRSDSMGLSLIYYYPQLSLTVEEEDDEE